MPRKTASDQEETEKEKSNVVPMKEDKDEQIKNLNRMLGAVLEYLSDDQVEEIDIEYLLQNTEGLQKWWDKYREQNRKKLEEEVKKSIEGLPLDELESIREQIKKRRNE